MTAVEIVAEIAAEIADAADLSVVDATVVEIAGGADSNGGAAVAEVTIADTTAVTHLSDDHS